MRAPHRLINVWLAAGLLVAAVAAHVRAQTPTPDLVVVPGTIQSALGCPGDWQPDCEVTALIYDAERDVWEATFELPAGSYEYKVALNGSWTENYGLDGQPGGANIPLTLAEALAVTFTYDHKTHTVTDSVNLGAGAPAVAPQPERVVVPGTIQSALGCPGDWQPDCEATALTLDPVAGIWAGMFTLPAGEYEYKVALNGSWGENYGLNAQRDGANIPLSLAAETTVTFLYDHATHWAADSVTSILATAPGSFQSELGCPGDWQPDCLASWLQDPDGDGVYVFTTTRLPAGDYEAKVALNRSWDENYGAGGARDGANLAFTVPEDGQEIYFGFNAQTKELLISAAGAPQGDLGTARAHWVNQDTLMWRVAAPSEGTSYHLFFAPEGGMTLGPDGVEGGQSIELKYSFGGTPAVVQQQFPHLAAGFAALKVDAADFDQIPAILKGQVAVVALDGEGALLDATSVQVPGVLDDVYVYSGPLGVTFEAGIPTLRVWAPTARTVALHLFDGPESVPHEIVPLALDPATGVWAVTGASDWKGKYYLYEVEVYVPATGRLERNVVTDPYSLSLSMNSRRSQIVDLGDPALKPAGWDALEKPALAAPEDIVLYELHVRDFSVDDPSVPAELRGTFRAFTVPGSNGMRHLAALAAAGLTHVHLLPAFDIASVNEDRAQWQTPDAAQLATYPPDSDQQQAALAAVRDEDGFNWGYDPFHYTVPEGSYAVEPSGSGRIREFREMVQALNAIGLRVVMDVVYNHTNASGQSERSVLDKIVPGYYYRLNPDGAVERSTCCENTASEHRMMEKLMLDSVEAWATAYKVDGFRFDLMGHHLLRNMTNVRGVLDSLTVARDGVDGRAIYVYGEGWNFGEVADNARGRNAVQLNIAGTGLGVFNDRLRDGVRGGGPFGDPREQGFATGLSLAPSGFEQGSPDDQHRRLLRYADWIRVGLAGNLRDFPLMDGFGNAVTGRRVDYNGAPAGYTADPQENIVYISAHDNETWFDAIQWKAAVTDTVADRVRMDNLGVSLVMLSQGVPFFHAGDDLLRSKSLDRNSYNSGDWFNRLDFTYQTNNWGVGLPSEGGDRWDQMRPLLADPALRAGPGDIQAAHAHFLEMLQIRRSSPLFRLRTAADVYQRLTFLNTGPDQIPGLIILSLTDAEGADLDPGYERIVVLFNAAPNAVTFTEPALQGLALSLHPIQQQSADEAVRGSAFDPVAGTFTIPGRTAAVFVLVQTTAERLAEAGPTSTPFPRPTVIPTVIAAAATPLPSVGGQAAAPTQTAAVTVAPTATRAPAATATRTPPAPASAAAPALPVILLLAMGGALIIAALLARRAASG
jgi:pullulanase-type alpha-1,6-glucosidase